MRLGRAKMARQKYLNNSGAGLVAQSTLDTMLEHLKLEADSGAMSAATQAQEAMTRFYERAATAVNANTPHQIAFMDSASRAWNAALYGAGLHEGNTIVTLSSEFGTNLVSIFHYARSAQLNVRVIECGLSGEFDLAQIEKQLRDGAQLVAISHAAAHCSIVNPVVEIGALCRRYGVAYLLDACQSVGQMPVDVAQIQCDALTATGRKWLCGPRGTGFLYVNSSDRFATPQVDLASADLSFSEDGEFTESVIVRPDARQFELWERSVASMLGLSEALAEWNSRDQASASEEIAMKANFLREAVAQNRALVNLGPTLSQSGIVGFVVSEPDRERHVAAIFAERGITISTMHNWDCPLHFPKSAGQLFRMAPHYYTDWSLVREVAEVISAV